MRIFYIISILLISLTSFAQIKSNFGIPTEKGDVEMYLPTIEDWNKLINRIDDLEKQLKDAKVNDPFAEIRNLTAKQIASNYTVGQNKQWAKKLGITNYSRLREPELSTISFEALNN